MYEREIVSFIVNNKLKIFILKYLICIINNCIVLKFCIINTIILDSGMINNPYNSKISKVHEQYPEL